MFYTIVIKKNRNLVAISPIDIYQGNITDKLVILLPIDFVNYNPNKSSLILKYITPKNTIHISTLERNVDIENGYYRFEYAFDGDMTENAGRLIIQLQIVDAFSNMSLGKHIINIIPVEHHSEERLPYYDGEYVVTPKPSEQMLPTGNKSMFDNVRILEIPFSEVENPEGGRTINIGYVL